MFSFDPHQYGEAFKAVLDVNRPTDLGPGKPNAAMRSVLDQLTVESAFEENKIVDHDAARGCLSGIWLLHDFLDESHGISQELETPEGSFWHGIMHRREPDYGNAKYWFRRVGAHRTFVDLAAEARQLTASQERLDPSAAFLADESPWDPYHFVDLCEQVARGQSAAGELGRQVARAEWQLLFDHCYRQALGLVK